MEVSTMKEWIGFVEGTWCNTIDVKDFIKKNYKYYEGDESFLSEKTEKTRKVWSKCETLLKEEYDVPAFMLAKGKDNKIYFCHVDGLYRI